MKIFKLEVSLNNSGRFNPWAQYILLRGNIIWRTETLNRVQITYLIVLKSSDQAKIG